MLIQWSHDLLADKPSIALQRRHNEHSIEELTSHVKPLPVWLKGKKEGLYLLTIGGGGLWGDKTYFVFSWYGCEEDFFVLIFFVLVMHKKKNVSVWPDVSMLLSWLIQAGVSEPEKSQYQIWRCIQAFRLKETCYPRHNTHKHVIVHTHTQSSFSLSQIFKPLSCLHP